MLQSSEAAALRSGTHPAQAFVDGYHTGLWLTIGLLAAGVVLSYVTLRRNAAADPGAESGPPSSASVLTALRPAPLLRRVAAPLVGHRAATSLAASHNSSVHDVRVLPPPPGPGR